MGRKGRDLSEYKTIFVNEPSPEAVDNWFRMYLEILRDKYGTETVVAALRELQKESATEEVKIRI